MNDREEAAALCEQYANQNDAASHGWGNSSGGKVYERNAVLFRLAASALRQTGEGSASSTAAAPSPGGVGYMDGIRDGRASLRDVLIETLSARGVSLPLGAATDPADIPGALARALDALRPTPPEVTDNPAAAQDSSTHTANFQNTAALAGGE